MKYVTKVNFMGQEFFYDLVEGRFFSEVDDRNPALYSFETLSAYSTEIKEESDFICITIAVTDACNLKCTYCFERHGITFLKEETIEKVCTLVQQYVKQNQKVKRLVVIWFGGEPLLNIKYILNASIQLQRLCKQLVLDYSAKIITNGVNLDSVIPYIDKLNLTDIQVTLDGTQNIHDSRRINTGGKGTFDKIIKNIIKIQSAIDLTIRVNVDRYNILDCYDLYDYIVKLPWSERVKVYFQPMLVEDYGGESKCYNGRIIGDEELNEEYLNLLEYTNTLEFPSFIGAFCNVDFPGSFVIGADARVCKCWADITNSNSSRKNLLKEEIEELVKYEAPNIIKNKKCSICEIFPICMGGCAYKVYSTEECVMRFKVTMSTIRRLYLSQMKEIEISFKILYNEMAWLKSIGCKIIYEQKGLKISSKNLLTTDFNFFVGVDSSEQCIRLADSSRNFENEEKKLLESGYVKEIEYDINYYCDGGRTVQEEKYKFVRLGIDEWNEERLYRKENRYTQYFDIYLEENKVGKCMLVVTDIIGVYDFEVLHEYRHQGHGTNILKFLVANSNKNIFIQTWSENISAQNCYEKAGFYKYEKLYRYKKKDNS